MNLALESRAECFSLGRELSPVKVAEIGGVAVANGFNFIDPFRPFFNGDCLAEYLTQQADIFSYRV